MVVVDVSALVEVEDGSTLRVVVEGFARLVVLLSTHGYIINGLKKMNRYNSYIEKGSDQLFVYKGIASVLVSQSADSNHFRGTAGICLLIRDKHTLIKYTS